jgi:hypothetical protein
MQDSAEEFTLDLNGRLRDDDRARGSKSGDNGRIA